MPGLLSVVSEASPPQAETSLLDLAKQQFPYLADKDIAFTQTPPMGDNRKLEFWPADEPGSKKYPRPKDLPLGRLGVQVFDPNTRPIDVLADYVSHYGVDNDSELQRLYRQFEQATPPEQMLNRYQEHRKLFGEQRPFKQWYSSTGLPEIFRGYTFDQWGDNAAEMYNRDQLKVLDDTRKYLGIAK